MTALPASGYLVEFGAGGDAAGDHAGALGALAGSGETPFFPVACPTRAENAYEEGVESGRAAAKAEYEAKLEQHKAAFDKELAAARQAWCREQSDKLAQHLAASLKGLEVNIAETAARLLKPFLMERVKQAAIEDLCASLEGLLTREVSRTINVSGPEDLLEALRTRLADTAAVTYTCSNECDVRVLVGQTQIETRLGAWFSRIEEAVR